VLARLLLYQSATTEAEDAESLPRRQEKNPALVKTTLTS